MLASHDSFAYITMFLLSFLTASLVGCVDNAQDLGPKNRELREVAHFNRIEASQDFWVIVDMTPGQASSTIIIEGERNLLPFVRTEVVNGALVIDSEAYLYGLHPIQVFVTAPRLEAVEAKEDAFIDVSGINALTFRAVGYGESSIHLEGKTERLEVAVNGSPGVHAALLESRVANETIEPSTTELTVELCATDALELQGSGDVENLCR